MNDLAKNIMSTLTSRAEIQTEDNRHAHAKRFFRKAAGGQISAVILWDEAGRIRRSGPGDSAK